MNTSTKYLVERLRRAAAEGMTRAEAVVVLDMPLHVIGYCARKYGINFPKKYVHHIAPKPATERELTMEVLYRSGQTLQQIGDAFGLTRERVRQLLARAAVTREEGGRAVTSGRRMARSRESLDHRTLQRVGCTREQYRTIPAKAKRAYSRQKANAGRRHIGWEFNLWQWWCVWQQSGKWHLRGRGQGYVMCRHGDEGPYSASNVFIGLATLNCSESKRKKSGLPIGVKLIHIASAGARPEIEGSTP